MRSFAQYVPVKKTVEFLLSLESVKEQLQQIEYSTQPDDVLRDVWDGRIIKDNLLFQHNASLGIILYQDSFEVVNPLGSGRKKHKVLAVYLTLANIRPHHRSGIDQICRERDNKYFGQDLLFGKI